MPKALLSARSRRPESSGTAESRLDLSRQLIQAQDRARLAIARELHDDIGQRMALLLIEMARLRRMLEGTAAIALTDAILNQLAEVAGDIQGLSHRCHPSKVDYIGLPAAAGSLCEELSAQHHIAVHYVAEGIPADLPHDIALTFFRVLQEALSNAMKHSGARRCFVSLRGTPDEVRLDITDDGCGFDVTSAPRNHGLGLVSMHERLNLVNGEIAVESGAGNGTRVRIRAPLRRELTVCAP
jgi:signal transduction histidine kinase